MERLSLESYLDIIVVGDDFPRLGQSGFGDLRTHDIPLRGTGSTYEIIKDSEYGTTIAMGTVLYCLGHTHYHGQPLERADEAFKIRDTVYKWLPGLCAGSRVGLG